MADIKLIDQVTLWIQALTLILIGWRIENIINITIFGLKYCLPFVSLINPH